MRLARTSSASTALGSADRVPVPLFDILLIAAGIVLLYAGGEALVRGAVALASRLGLSELVIGLTVVSFGTSSPELAATLAASLDGASEVAFGNVVGSNIANVGLVLGLTAAIFPVSGTATLLRREIPAVLAASGLLVWFVRDSLIGRGEGLIMLALLVVALVYVFRADHGESDFGEETLSGPRESLPRAVLLVIVGIGLLVFGADLLVQGARSIAEQLGISDRVIGLTMVAFGTSLPELASSLVAAVKKQGDIVLGNVIGSNFFNILFILGMTTVVQPIAIGPGTEPHLLVMIGLSLSLWPLLYLRSKIGRAEGSALVLLYLLYVLFLFR